MAILALNNLKLLIILSVSAFIFLAIGTLHSVFINNVVGETGEGTDVFKVILTIIGATKENAGGVIALVTVNDHSKVKFFSLDVQAPQEEPVKFEGNETNITMTNTSSTSSVVSSSSNESKIIEYVATFPNVNVNDGDSYNACILPTKTLKLICQEGKNSPAKRPEFVDINLGSNVAISDSSSSILQDQGDDKEDGKEKAKDKESTTSKENSSSGSDSVFIIKP